MRAGLLILYTGLFLAGCSDKDKIPNGILPKKEMQAILWDMMRADQFLTSYVLNRDTSLNRKNESIKLYQKIFLLHKVKKKEVFQKSFSFYKKHPALLKVVLDSLSKMPVQAPADTVKPQVKTDTLHSRADTTGKDTIKLLKKIKRIRSN